MTYQIKATGEPIELHVLANCDNSVVGLEVDNCKIIEMDYDDFYNLVIATRGEQEKNRFIHTLFKYHVFPRNSKETKENNESIIVLEKAGKSVGRLSFVPFILETLKLYQATDIFSCYMISYCVKNGQINHGGTIEFILREHGLNTPSERYSLSDERKNSFNQWLESHQIVYEDQNQKFRTMLRLYLDSFLLHDANQSFVMIMIVLEMLFGSQNELVYRISRGTGVFLSHSREEMREIMNSVKSLYNRRSQYVHSGKSISYEELYQLRDIVRKVLVVMYEKGMHKEGYDFETFAKEIVFDGYPKSN